jgi:hypothetical protein
MFRNVLNIRLKIMTTVYLFDKNNYYTHAYVCQESPLESGVFIIPTDSLLTAPTIVPGEWPVAENGAWVNQPDFRGQIWYDQTSGVETEITTAGTPAANLGPTLPLPLLLAQAKASQISLLQAAYNTSITAPVVSYTTVAGHNDTFNQAASDKLNLQNAITGALGTQNWPLNFWLNSNGQPVTPFTFADLESLAAVIEKSDVPNFSHLLAKIALVNNATTVADVQAVTW